MAARTARDDDDLDDLAEINVTPFIDVMLVLLIVFMIAAPLATVDIGVDLPGSNATPTSRDEPVPQVALLADRSLTLDAEPVGREDLAARLLARGGDPGGLRVDVQADRNVGYGEVMDLMNLLRDAGFTRLALVARDTRGEP
ncbi:biopolymer transporter ExbD [Dokdonella sp. MW10]|uniref:biopolymer transporter ExbD n=1 Tax=Dokdonella sp. MW10 TaxID=2992926 RepID=UPI003F7E22D7